MLYGARLGPGRALWCVLWAFKVAGVGSFSRDCVPTRRAESNSSRASSFSLCDSHKRCFCVCVRVSMCVCVIIASGRK